MDGSQFDRWTRVLTDRRSRRTALGVLAGMTVLGLEPAGARRRPGTGVRAARAGKTAICHRDEASGTYAKITVANRALKAHQNHGDFLHGACCRDADCESGETCRYTAGDLTKASVCTATCDANQLGAGCYWLNLIGQWELVPTVQTLELCQELDGCAAGGGDGSDGGCYRWATATTVIAPCNDDWSQTCCPI